MSESRIHVACLAGLALVAVGSYYLVAFDRPLVPSFVAAGLTLAFAALAIHRSSRFGEERRVPTAATPIPIVALVFAAVVHSGVNGVASAATGGGLALVLTASYDVVSD